MNSSSIDITKWYSLYPKKIEKYTVGAEGNIIISTKRTNNPWIKFIFNTILKRNPYKKIHLDVMGSCVWNMCDGNNSIREIINEIKLKNHDHHHLEERIIVFLNSMFKNNFIQLYEKTYSNRT